MFVPLPPIKPLGSWGVCVCVCVCTCVSSVMSDSLGPHGLNCWAPLSMEFSRQEYWSGCHYLLQGIFPTQGSNLRLCLLYWQGDSSPAVPLGSWEVFPLTFLKIYPLVIAMFHAIPLLFEILNLLYETQF